jgi:hypothetical protein
MLPPSTRREHGRTNRPTRWCPIAVSVLTTAGRKVSKFDDLETLRHAPAVVAAPFSESGSALTASAPPLQPREAVAQVRRGAFGEIREARQAVLTASEPASREISLSETPLRIAGSTYATASMESTSNHRGESRPVAAAIRANQEPPRAKIPAIGALRTWRKKQASRRLVVRSRTFTRAGGKTPRADLRADRPGRRRAP